MMRSVKADMTVNTDTWMLSRLRFPPPPNVSFLSGVYAMVFGSKEKEAGELPG